MNGGVFVGNEEEGMVRQSMVPVVRNPHGPDAVTPSAGTAQAQCRSDRFPGVADRCLERAILPEDS